MWTACGGSQACERCSNRFLNINDMGRSVEELLHDAVLVLRCRRRDEKAFEELVNRWEPRLYYYLRRIVEDENAVWDVL